MPSLVFLSLGIYFVHYLIFQDAHHIYIYLVGDLAFLPVEVLLVTLIVDQMLGMREKHAVMEKMNMVIGAFFSEMGLDLLKQFIAFGICPADIAAKLKFYGKVAGRRLQADGQRGQGFRLPPGPGPGRPGGAAAFLLEKREFFLRLLENPSLLEHDTFTDLLWATNHLSEELAFRQDLGELSEPDFRHIEGDIRRAFQLLIFEWLQYMKHLKNYYPYLFSLAVRTNPFDREACVEVS